MRYISPVIAITPDLPTKEPDNSLSMGDEHLSTILKRESNEVIKSSVKNLVPIPSESKVSFDNESECDVPVYDESSPIFTTFSNHLFDCNDDFTSSDDKSLSNEDVPMENFKIYSNSLFDDEEIISTKIDQHYFNAESNLLESLINQDTLIDSSPKFDYILKEFSGKLAHIDPIPPRIEEADFQLLYQSQVKGTLNKKNTTQDQQEGPTNFALMAYRSQGNYMPPRADLSFVRLNDSIFKFAISESITSVNEAETSTSKTSKESLEKPKTVRTIAPIIKEWESDSEDDNVVEKTEVKKTVKPSLEKIEFVNARNTTIEN
nr:hypothetical protein [Tanacetum cinerariifolium]